MQDRLILHYGDLAIASYRGVVVCRAGSGDPARISVGGDRLILTSLSIGQECPLLIRWRSGDRQLQGLSPARVNVGEGQALALRQKRL